MPEITAEVAVLGIDPNRVLNKIKIGGYSLAESGAAATDKSKAIGARRKILNFMAGASQPESGRHV